jgi:hypothetical protein
LRYPANNLVKQILFFSILNHFHTGSFLCISFGRGFSYLILLEYPLSICQRDATLNLTILLFNNGNLNIFIHFVVVTPHFDCDIYLKDLIIIYASCIIIIDHWIQNDGQRR